jgi:hypothetical protein
MRLKIKLLLDPVSTAPGTDTQTNSLRYREMIRRIAITSQMIASKRIAPMI